MLKKTYLLLTCAAVSLAYADTKDTQAICPDKVVPAECAVTEKDMGALNKIATDLESLKHLFQRWGVPAVWSQVNGDNSNKPGSEAVDSAYSLFANAKHPMFAVVAGKFVSADPKLNNQDASAAEHVKKIQAALNDSKDGKVTVEYTRMEKNPADNDGPMIEVHVKAVAWDQRAFDQKDEFFVYREVHS